MIVPLTILVVFSFGSRDALGKVVLGFSLQNYVRFFCGPYLLSVSAVAWSGSFDQALYLPDCRFSDVALASLFRGQDKAESFYDAHCRSLVDKFSFAHVRLDNNSAPNRNFKFGFSFLLMVTMCLLLLTRLMQSLGMVYNYLPYMILPLSQPWKNSMFAFWRRHRILGATPWISFLKGDRAA